MEVGSSLKNGSYEMRERFAISSSAEEAVEEKIGRNFIRKFTKLGSHNQLLKVLRVQRTVYSGWGMVLTSHPQLPDACLLLEMLTLYGTDIQSGNS